MTMRLDRRQLWHCCAVVIALVCGSPAHAESLPDRQVCIGRGNPGFDQRFKACTAIIESPDETPDSRALAYGNRAVAYQNNQNTDAAIREYDLSLAIDSTSASARRFSGTRNFLKKQYDVALADFDEAIRLEPANSAAFNGRGLSYRALKQNEKALAAFSEAMRLNPAYAPYISNRALIYRDMGDVARAIADYDRAIELDPVYFVGIYGRGSAYSADKQYDRAIADFDKAIALRPAYAATYFSRAIAYRAKGDSTRAIADYDAAIRLDPKMSGAFINRALLHYAKADYDRAIADYDEAIRLDPKNPAIVDGRGTAYREKGDIARALADYGRAIEIDAGFAPAYGHRCDDRIRTGRDLKLAIADCDQALRLAPSRFRSISSRGYAHLKLGSHAAALTDFNTALAADPKDAWSLFGRGLAKWNSKDIAGAEADVEAANKIRSGMPRLVSTYYGVTAHRDFTSKLAKARISEVPMIYAVAEGPADACGPGCSAWIVADGSFDTGAEKRLRDFLRGLKGRQLPIFFNSTGGSMEQSYGIGKMLRSNKMTVGVGRTMPDACTSVSPACRQTLQAAAPIKATLRTEGAICHSACVYALMGGAVRQVSSGALVGVHKPIRSSVDEGKSGRSVEQIDALLHSRRRSYAQQMGVDPAVVELADSTPYEHMRILTREELARFKMETAR